MTSIESLPPWLFRRTKTWFDVIRLLFFTKDVDVRDVRVHASVDEVRAALGDEYFTNSWELSYNYEGEDLNMRRPLRKDDEYEWYQTHVRAWEQDDGTVLLECHEDAEPTEHPYYHLNPPEDMDLDHGEAVADTIGVLDRAGIDFELV